MFWHMACLFILIATPGISAASATGHEPVAGLMDVRTTFSDGAYEVEDVARMAAERGFEVLIINDHDRVAMEFGTPPLRNLTKKKLELSAINKHGANRYLAAIEDAAKKNPGLVIVPGSRSSPFYYWTGEVPGKDLTAHQHERQILTVGLENLGDLETLPILHNGTSTKYLLMFKMEILLTVLTLLAGTILIVRGGFIRFTGLAFVITGFVFLINVNPFRTTPFDPYHGDQGIAPFQLLIDDVAAKEGLTFWGYLEAKPETVKMGIVDVRREAHPEVLKESRDYTGFAVIGPESVSLTDPGRLWDSVLIEYCKGTRKAPVWGIAASGYRKEGIGNEQMGSIQTVFWLKERSKKGVLEALRRGKMYACRGDYPMVPRLDEFSVSTPAGDKSAISGDEIVLKDLALIRIVLSSTEPPGKPVNVRLIRSGELVKTFKGTLPLKVEYADTPFKVGEKAYYRIDMTGSGSLISNPIFVTRESGS